MNGVTGIASARLKLARAWHHIDDLARIVSEYQDANEVEVRVDFSPSIEDENEIDCEVAAVGMSDAPDEWALITGDALANLRAALDRAVHPHAEQFPILLSNTNSKGEEIYVEEIFDAVTTALILRHQPFCDPLPTHHPLGLLRELTNRDRHCRLKVSNQFRTELIFARSDDYEIVDTPESAVHELVPGAVFKHFRLRLNPGVTQSQLTYNKRLRATVVINIPDTDDDVPLIASMKSMHTQVSEILDQLEALGIL
ncbi:hypothetical protein [Nocardia implantans]|uniref:Uncharacterized protein n=1 Tax=Nocardia implantans TaxID=3108168 RepID=A0ABU6AMC6_9NOCA|nr:MULTISPECIES: hypothetical protein [unclassified Nocardia]MBF6193524.1 hypothetical protein [Nocardia beijingensis]MEA3532132.1 hypothetical protein [Nocardia sp. CDC192]MEB3508623.1 hypothetical protein [Nocardia sp. CDC186]